MVRWRVLAKVPGVLDVVGPRSDGRLVVASSRGLFLLDRRESLKPFARGPSGYAPAVGETYVALSLPRRVRGAGCSFRRDDVYALDPDSTPGLAQITRGGTARRFADFRPGSFPSGIAFDAYGRFGYRLLVTVVIGGRTALYAFDCHGRARVLVRRAPRVEGGIAVAPLAFGRFGGQLVAADEYSGRLFAFDSRGHVRLVAMSGLPIGADTGIESVGFVPPGFGAGGRGYLADLGAPGSPTRGTDSILTLTGAALVVVGVHPGDAVVATEASARTIAVRCGRRCTVRCTVRRVAIGPGATHGEGHIAVRNR